MSTKRSPIELGAELGFSILNQLDELENEKDNVKKSKDAADVVLESKDSKSYEELRASLGEDFDNAIKNLEAEENKEPGTEKSLTAGIRLKAIKKLRAEIFEIIDRPEFDKFKRKIGHPEKLIDFAKIVVQRAKESGDEVVNFDVLDSLSEIAKKIPAMQTALRNIKENIAKEAEAKREEERSKAEEAIKKAAAEEATRIKAQEDAKKATEDAKKKKKRAKPKTKLEKEYIDFANNFLDRGVSFCYKEKREEKGWTGYNQEVLEFIKTQFEELAKKANLGSDDVKVAESWNLITKNIEEKINVLEEEIKKETGPKLSAKEEYMKLSPEEVWNKLEAAGATQKEQNYFFNLDLAGRVDFFMCSDDELREKIKKLKEQGEGENQLVTQEDLKLEKEKKEARIKLFGDNVKNLRTIYLQKEYEFNKTASRLKRVFKMDKIDMGNAEEDLKKAKEEYQESIKFYIDAIVDGEGVNDEEEREIIYRYVKVGEALQVMDAKEDIKFQNHPYFEATKRDFGVGALSFIDKYKELIGKPKEFLQKKTNSKILGFGGGMIAVGGAMAFAASYVPGIRGITRVLSIAVATKGFYEKAEHEALLEKEKSTEKGVEELEKRLEYIDELGANVNETFKRELGLISENILEEVKKEKEAVGKRMALSLVKAIAVSTVFYEAGKIIGGLFGGSEMQDGKINSQTSHPHGGTIHSQANYPSNMEADNPIVQNQTAIREALDGIKNNEASVAGGGGLNSSEGAVTDTPPASVEVPAGEFPSVQPQETATPSYEYQEIKIGETTDVEIEVLEGKGIKDTISALLAERHNELTAGNMGWDPDGKYASVEEWADRRAVGIVAEFKAEHPDYDLDKVSLESKITMDLSNPADIKITDFVDGQNLENVTSADTHVDEPEFEDVGDSTPEIEGKSEVSQDTASAPLEKAPVTEVEKNNSAGGIETGKQVNPEIVEDIRDNMAKKEIQFAYRLGIAPDHYSQINNITVAKFIEEIKRTDGIVHGGGEDSMDIDKSSKLPTGSIFGNGEASNRTLGRVLKYLMQDGKIDNPNQSVAEVLRNADESDLRGALNTYEGIFGNISAGDSAVVMDLDENKMYSEYMISVIQSELREMLDKNYGEGRIMRELAALRGVTVGNLSNNELLMSFKEATKNSVGDLVYKDHETVGKYVLRALREAYERGKIDEFKESIASIDKAKMAA